MVEFVNGKPTGTLAKFRLCIEGSVIKILGNTFFERDYGSDGDRVTGEAGPFCIRWHFVLARTCRRMQRAEPVRPGAEVDHQPGATPKLKSVACTDQRIAWRRRRKGRRLIHCVDLVEEQPMS
jgi:hypothetical protein